MILLSVLTGQMNKGELNVQKTSSEGRTFPPQSSFPVHQVLGHTIAHHADRHMIMIDERLVTFTRTEYQVMRLILYAAEHYHAYVPFVNLRRCFRHPPDNLRRLLYRRINTLRAKLWPFELDIVNVRDQGYTLVHKASHRESELS
jgi:DNA-binding response OmpR family regulator